MAAVGRLQGRDKRRPPPRREAGRPVERAEAREPGIDDPELVAIAPGHLVDLDVARDVAGARQEAGVVPAGRLELGGHGRDVDKLPDLDRRADRQSVADRGHAHRRLEGAEVGVEVVPLVADHHQLAGLVGGDQKRRTELRKSAGKLAVWTARRVAAAGGDSAGGGSAAGRAFRWIGRDFVVTHQLGLPYGVRRTTFDGHAPSLLGAPPCQAP